MRSIYIVTISDGTIKPLKSTIKSIDQQSYKNYKNLIISKRKINTSKVKFKSNKRIFIWKENSSIYEAMNCGLNRSKSNPVIFLNAGDVFSSKISLKLISKYIKKNPKNCLMFVSILKNDKDYFIPKKKTFFSKNFLTHSSFVRPPNQKDDGFDSKNKITADGIWMKNNLNTFSIKKIYAIVTTFYLGGVSNLPSKKSLKMKSNTGFISLGKEFIKLFLLKLVGKSMFYKIIYIFKYNKVTLNEIKRSINYLK